MFLWINIIGLAIGLAVSIMLVLFVVNELGYDRHFANKERIVRLNTVIEEKESTMHYPINLRRAYTEIPSKVPGVEAAAQIYKAWDVEVVSERQHFQNLSILYVDPEFLDVFQLEFLEGTPATAIDMQCIVLTRPFAEIIFGSAGNAIDKTVFIDGQSFVVTAVVEPLPANSHFSFDLLTGMKSFPWIESMQGLEFFTYYLIDKGSSVNDARKGIEKAYTDIISPFTEQFAEKGYGETEMLTDLYLHSKSDFALGKTNDMKSVWILIILAGLILFMAITNFLNLFVVQGETRMNEIGVRKSNGAQIKDIVKQFFSEISLIVFIAYAAGFALAIAATPYFSKLIGKDIDLSQLINPVFITCIILLFIITVTITALYPSFYLSRFNPIDILEKRIRFSKRRLTSVVVILQSVITIILFSYILILNKQTNYLENTPKGYNAENVINFMLNKKTIDNYKSIKNELLKVNGIQHVSGGQHLIGQGGSGQGIALQGNNEKSYSIDEYRILPGLCELMEFQLIEGEFFKENMPENKNVVVLNEAAVKMLGMEYPVVGKLVEYKGPTEIIGVVKDFMYGEPSAKVQPLALFNNQYVQANVLTIKYAPGITRTQAERITLSVMHQFDPDFVINPFWSEDIYTKKFESLKTQMKTIFISSLLSAFIAMMGLLAIHMYTARRRTKEIGIRRINGADEKSIFMLLSADVIKWIIIAGVIAVPVAYYISSQWLNGYVNRIDLNPLLFIVPVLIQCVMAVLVTMGVSLKVLSQNPVEALKK